MLHVEVILGVAKVESRTFEMDCGNSARIEETRRSALRQRGDAVGIGGVALG